MKPVLVIKSPLLQEYLEYLDDVMYNPHPGFHSMRVQPTDYNTPAEARALTTPTNVNFKQDLASMGMNTNLPLSTTELGHTEPLMGRHVYPFQAFSMNPNMFNSGTEADLPRSYKIGRLNRPRNLQMYAFEGRDTTPQRFSNNLQTEGIIYGDVDESNIMPVFNKPVHYPDLRVAARSLLPSSGFTPDQLSEKQQSIARQMMRIGLPPVLTDEHLMIPDITDPHALDSIRDDTRQWSQNQQRLNIPTEDLLYASEPMDIAMQLLKNEPADYADTYQQVRNNIGADGEFMTDEELNAINERYSELHDDESHLEEYYNLLEAIELEKKRRAEESFDGIGFNEETGFTRSEPMDIAMRLLKNQPYHEMSNDELDEILYGKTGYDVGESGYTRDKTISSQKEKDLAFQELLTRQRETEGNPVSVFDKNQEEKSRLVDFYEPQFAGQNISPDVFIPQNEKEGQAAYEFMEDGEMGEHIDERLMDINEFMPGKTFITDEDYADKYNYLRATAPPEVAENFLNRYRDFVMRNSENPEYVNQRLMQMFDENQKVTAPQYTQEFPTDASIFDTIVPYQVMNSPDATGFQHDWQAKNASEPMNIAFQLLKERVSPEAKRHKLEYDKKYESSPERVKYREDLNRERRRRGIYGSHDHKDISHTEGGKLTLEGEHENRARHFKDKGTLREL